MIAATQPQDDWFAQFNEPVSFDPAQRSANTGITGGSVLPSPTTQDPASQQAFQTAMSTIGQPSAGGQSWDQNYFTQTFGTPGTPQELLALEQQITAAGGKVLKNAAGVAGKIQTPDGRIIDVINAAGAGGRGFQWLDGGGGQGGNQLAALGYGFGSSMAPWTEQFAGPTAQQAMDSPGVEFALAQKNRLMQGNAAARGISGNYRAQEAIGQSLGQSALGMYGDIYNRSLGEYGLRRDNFFQNQDRPFEKNYQLAQLGKPT